MREMSDREYLLRRAAAGIALLGLVLPALAVWLWLPPMMPKQGPALPPVVREALRADGSRPATWLARVHLGELHAAGLLARERHLRYIVRECILALWLTTFWSQDEMLDALGAIGWTGDQRYGLEAGAQYYFRRPLARLTSAEVATLIAILRSPRVFDPACHPDRTVDARNAVLGRLQTAGAITPVEATKAMATPLTTSTACSTP